MFRSDASRHSNHLDSTYHNNNIKVTAPSLMLRAMTTAIPRRIFRSLASDHRPWTLKRTLQSENPADLQGQLRGVAGFELKTKKKPDTDMDTNMEMLYTEEGEMTSGGGIMAGVRLSKRYIWRFTPGQNHGQEEKGEDDGTLSVWFVKPTTADEPDYLFHELDFNTDPDDLTSTQTLAPPEVHTQSRVLVTRGEHLCVRDMYSTTYAFRVDVAGDVVSWMSRHVVRGPMKNQDIVNMYTR